MAVSLTHACAAAATCPWAIVITASLAQSAEPVCANRLDTLTQSANAALFAPGIACTAAGGTISMQNYFARSFDLGVKLPGESFEVCAVEFGFSNTGPALDGAVNLYADTNGGDPMSPASDLQLLVSAPVELPNTDLTVLTATFDPPVCIAAGTILVVEVDVPPSPNPGGGLAVYAANSLGQSNDTFLRAMVCGFTNYVSVADLGFPNSHWVLAVCGNCSGNEPCVVKDSCPADFAPPSAIAGSDCQADGDGLVGPGDLAELLANWGEPGNRCADVSPAGAPDGLVGPADLAELLSQWGACP